MTDEKNQIDPPASEQREVISDGRTDQGVTEGLGGESGIHQSGLNNPPVQAYDPDQQHDVVRTIITCSFIAIFALTILASLAIVTWSGSVWTNAKELLQLVLPAETALMGSAIGFYFGSQKSS